MKYIKLFETYKTVDEIGDWLNKYGVENYTINDDFTVDVDGDVNLYQLTEIPIQFRNISGDFSCHNNQLTSLKGAPSSVGDNFYCYNNQLTSLEGAPSSVSGSFSCHNNQLISLEGAPSSVGGDFSCSNNQLTSLEGCPSSVGGSFYCYNNQLTSLEGCPSNISGDFYCHNNLLTSLEGCPSNIGGDFSCDNNQLTSLEGAPVNCMSRGGFYNKYDNKFKFNWDQEKLDEYWEKQIENNPLIFKDLEINNREKANKSNQISQALYDEYAYLNRADKSGLLDINKR
jgi:hypothetical protein